MKTFYLLVSVGFIAFLFLGDEGSERRPTTVASAPSVSSQAIAQESPSVAVAIVDQFGSADVGKQIRGSGTVVRVLSDDNDGSRHQRFILRLGSGQTLLVAHNIDLAPRIDGIAVNDSVEFYGQYESSPQGGVVHWTHNDPNGRHEDGWLRSKGRTYR